MTDDHEAGPKAGPKARPKQGAASGKGPASKKPAAPRPDAAAAADQPVFDMELAREAILEATLGHVPFDGWTLLSLRAGVSDAGLDESMAVRGFPGGVAELVEFHSTWADRRMLEGLTQRDLAAMKVRERVTTAVRLRLEQNAKDREAVRRGALYLARPQHAVLACRCLYRTVDAIWYAAGDTATDYNFYTKRALLAGVYSATVLYWLNDNSEDNSATWAFLDRRIRDAMRMPQVTARLRDALKRLPDPFRLFRTAASRQ